MNSALSFLVGLIVGWILATLVMLGLLWLVSILARNHELHEDEKQQINIKENGD